MPQPSQTPAIPGLQFHLSPHRSTRPDAHSRTTRVRRLLVAAIGISLTLSLGTTPRAQGTGHSGGSHVGDVFGDLIHIKRDPSTGQPILQKRWVALPNDQFGYDYCPIPIDAIGFEIPFLDLTCDPDPQFANAVVAVDYFGRLSGGRTQERNLRMHFDEAIRGIQSAETVTLDEASRLRLGTDCTSVGVCASWRSIDSPQENLALYRWVMKYGHIQTDPAEVDTAMGGDPAAGTQYHPALSGSDWAKFMSPVTDLLPRSSAGQCFSGGFNAACAAPQALTSIDFFLAGALLSGAADKTGRMTPDLVQYMNRILKITEDTPETLKTVNTLPALIRDDNGTIAPAPAGLAWPANELFVDFSAATYLRSDWFATSVSVIQESAGVFVPTTVNLTTWLNFINGPMTKRASALPAFLASSSDALRTVQFIHEYAVPADLWAATGATTTTVNSVVVGYSSVNQNVALTATVTGTGSVTGTMAFFVRDAQSIPVGLPVTVPVAGGGATATYVLPGGTAPQTLTLIALFTPTNSSTTSQAVGTLTVAPAPTLTTVLPLSVPSSSSDQVITLAATVTASPGDVVNEGTLTFTVRDAGGTTIGSPLAALVVGGSASVPFTVPGGLPAQRLTVIADYLGTPNYAPSTGTNLLSIGCLPVAISPTTLPTADAGKTYTQKFSSDGVAPTLFTLVGTLPTGLSFSVDTLSGVPTGPGSYTFRLDAVDAVGCTGTRNYALTVAQLVSIVTGSGTGMEGVVNLFSADGTVPANTGAPTSLTPFPGFMNGIHVALGDVTGDGVPDTIAALGPGGGPQVRVFSGATGQLVRDFQAFPNWSGAGLFVATGDVNHDGVGDIIAAQGWGAPQVRVFSGTNLALLYDFTGGTDLGSSGARVAAGDVNGDGNADVVVASGPGVAPVVRVFSGANGAVLREFTGFDNDLPNGMFVAAGDVNGDALDDIVIGAGEGTTSRVRVFDAATGTEITLFSAFEPWRIGGVRVASADINGDGRAEIIAASGPGDPPVVHVFDGKTGALLSEFLAYAAGYTGGIYVGAIR